MRVRLLQLLSDLLGHVVQLDERLGVVEATQGTVVVVARYAVVASTVHIQRGQGEALCFNVRIETLEQAIGQVIVQKGIEVLRLVYEAAAHKGLDAALSKCLYWLEDGVLYRRFIVGSVVSIGLGERSPHQSVTEAECGSAELVYDMRVQILIVSR